MAQRSSRASLAVLAVALALIAGAVFYLTRDKPKKRTPDTREAPAATRGTPSPSGHPTDDPTTNPAKPGGDQPGVRKLADNAARQRLLRAIAHARARRAAAASGSGPGTSAERPAPALQPTLLTRTYIQKTMRGVVGLLKECYELARVQNKDLSGRLVVEFEIEGEPEIGGIVSTAQVQKGDDSPLGNDPTLSECVRETVMSLEFEPPENGGKVVVRYPFVFRSDK